MKTYFRRLAAAIMGQDLEFEDVRRFQEKFKQLSHYDPGFLTERKLKERMRFLQEELDELGTAKTLEDQADALVDLVYVAKGTAVMMGLPWRELWDDVQRANMAKVIGTTHRGNLVDVCKPPGWVKPQGAKILEANGWPFGDASPAAWAEFGRDDDANRPATATIKTAGRYGTIPAPGSVPPSFPPPRINEPYPFKD